MSDYMTDGAETWPEAEGRGARAVRLVNVAGAAMSLALILGMTVWGYRLLVRDVSGIPVIERIEGAFRVQPDDPGGVVAPHQDLAVNEIAAVGTAGGPVDRVTLAPEPEALADEDAAPADLAHLEVDDAAPVAADPLAALADAAGIDLDAEMAARMEGADADGADGATRVARAEPPADTPVIGTPRRVEDAPEDALATDMAIAEALSPSAPAPEDDRPESATSLFPEEEGLLTGASSPRPLPRPGRRVAAVTAVATAAAPAPAAAQQEVDVANLARGTRLVQLGAFAAPEVARTEWARLTSRFADYFDGKRRVVQRAETNGKVFYRLRAEGFQDLADARRFCSALLAARTDCIPVEVR